MEQPEDALYGVPLDEFTQRRNELARKLADEGDAESAARIRKLRKPTTPAWVVNQLARRKRADIRKLLDNASALQDASAAKRFRERTKERHDLVEALIEEAERVMNEHHIAASAAALRAISQTLYAATGEEERDLLERGVLERPLESTGFEAFSMGPFAPEEEDEDEGPSAAEIERAEVEEELAAAEERLQQLTQEAAEARAAATAAEAAVRDARRARDQLRTRLTRLKRA